MLAHPHRETTRFLRPASERRGDNLDAGRVETVAALCLDSAQGAPSEKNRQARGLRILSHRMYVLISFRKSTPPQNRQLIVYYY